MTALLQKAFDAASQLSPQEQDLFAERMLAELAAEDEFDRKIADTADQLDPLIDEALAEYRAGKTKPMFEQQP